MSATGWSALARHIVRARQLGRWRSRREFAAHLGISPRTLDSLEGAKRTSYSRATVTAVELGLGWAAGSFDRVVAGKRPTRAEDPGPGAAASGVAVAVPRCPPDPRRDS